MSYTVTVDDRCTACGACLVTCPERALLAAPKRPATIESRCTGCLACIEICPRDALTIEARGVTATRSPGGEIEAESFRILAERVDLSGFGPLVGAVVARIVHASADVDFASTMVADEAAVAAGVAALRSGAPVIADVEMVARGIRGPEVSCHLGDIGDDGAQAMTRSAAGMRRAAARHPHGAIVAVGCAPTALAEVLRLAAEDAFDPALVVGLPVGFVGAAEAKAALRASGLPAVSNVGEKGGSAVAAAAVNAMWRLAQASSVATSP